MKWVNMFKLPQPFAEAIMEDLYYGKREEGLRRYCEENGLELTAIIHYSVGELIKSPRQVLLARRHLHEMLKDVATEVFRILGTAIHLLLWTAAKRMNDRGDHPYYRAEERLFTHVVIDGVTVVISGEPDLVGPDDVIDDYKVTAVWSWLKGVKDEWTKQLNVYAWLRWTVLNKETKGLRICFVLRDWNVNETVQKGYPPAGAQVMAVPQWTLDETWSFIKERVRIHLAARPLSDDEQPECSDDEMWARPDAWAVIREGGSRAAKVFTAEFATPTGNQTREEAAHLEAVHDMNSRNDKLKKNDKPYIVEHRPGERTKCLRFCDAKPWCNQYNEYAAAAFREPVAVEQAEPS